MVSFLVAFIAVLLYNINTMNLDIYELKGWVGIVLVIVIPLLVVYALLKSAEVPKNLSE